MSKPCLPRRAALPLFAAVLAALSTTAAAGPNDVFFSEYAEGSSNNKVLEIYNNTGASIDLAAAAYKIRVYANGAVAPGSTFNLSGTLAAGGVHVVAHASTASPCLLSPAANQAIALNYNGNDAVELVRGAGNEVLDVIGQVGVDPGAAGWGTDPANTTDNTIRRKTTVTSGDTSGGDAFDPSTQWDGYAVNTCDGFGTHTINPGATSFSIDDASVTEGNAGTTVLTFTVTKSGSGAGSVDYATMDGSATEASGDYVFSGGTLNFGAGSGGTNSSQTISVTVNGDIADEGVETLQVLLSGSGVTFTRDTGTGSILNDDATCSVTHSIMQIQGTAHLSTLDGMTGITTKGVITARDSNGFYMQDPQGDGNANTSDGILVFTSSAPAGSLAVGDQVCVTGEVDEFRPGGVSVNGLTITELKNASITEIPGLFASPVVTPTLLGAGGRPFPTTVIDNDTANGMAQGNVEIPAQTTYDPAEDGIDFYESLEGMLVRINNPVAVSPDPGNFGEIWMVSDGLSGHLGSGRNSRGGITMGATDGNPERFMVSASFSGATVPTTVNVGDSFTQGGNNYLLGIGDTLYISGLSSGYYYFAPTSSLARVSGGIAPEVTAITGSADKLTVADYNVENLAFTNPQAKFDGLAAQIVNNLKSPDILALMEVQDDNGAPASGECPAVADGTVSAGQTLAKLKAAITAAGGPSYSHTQIDPQDCTDGGEPGGNIRLAYLYNTARVSFVGGSAGDATTATQPQLSGGKLTLSQNPGRIDPTNPDFAVSRKPLAAVFEFNGRRVLLVANHFSSKGGSDPAWGRLQPPVNGSIDKRSGQATAVNKFVDAALALDPNARIVVLGDMNEFSFNEPLHILTGAQATGPDNPIAPVLTDLADEAFPAEERYTYVFEGQSQTLDHLLVSDALVSGSEIDILHINSEFDDQKSDHDPSLAALSIPACEAGTLAFAGAPYAIAETNADQLLTVTVRRSGGDCGAVSVRVGTADPASGVAATAGDDYTAVSSQLLSWADGDNADKTLVVTIKGDALNELNESFALQLSSVLGGATAGGNTSATIANDDPLPTVSFAFPTSALPEDWISGFAFAELRLSAPSGRDVIVPYTVAGSAIAGIGGDYTNVTANPLTIPAGSTSASIAYLIADDATVEPDETIITAIAVGVMNATVGSGTMHTHTIWDDETTLGLSSPILGFSSPSIGTPSTPQTLTLTNRSAHGILFVGDPSFGGANAADFAIGTNHCGELPLGPGHSCTISVVFTPRDLGVRNASLSIPSDAAGSPAIVTLRGTGPAIVGKPGRIGLYSASVSAKETSGVAVFKVVRANGKDGAVSVQYTTAPGTAVAGSDYASSTGTLTWAAGDSTAKLVNVVVVDDHLVEGKEDFTLTLSGPTGGATLGRSSSKATITSVDRPGMLAFGVPGITVSESAGTATVTVSRSGGDGNAASIHYATADGTALAGNDYGSVSGDLTWAAGESGNRSFTIPITWDSLGETSEHFSVLLSNPSGGAKLGSRNRLTVKITNVAH
ncbi:Calx-beta domain-containing protein [Solimonas sp. K1W22B-7]|uniref:Calx-beta domain-containing protein n=1 Tax=Solimonas sp. K1W22B-7 TaxID=2303331 RepID=UPI0013C480E1|nr:Calx-beta domain-containing protein [Solimonas sp. K1W22B-7]